MEKILINGAAALAITYALASCTAQSGYILEPDIGSGSPDNVIALAQPVQVKAYSSNESISILNLNPSVTKWQWDSSIAGWPETTDRGEQVSNAEYQYVIEYLRNHPDEGYTSVDLSTYFLQNVGSSWNTYNLEFKDQNGNIHHSQVDGGGSKMNYLLINGFHINDFNASYGPRVYVENLPLANPTYQDSYGSINRVENKFRFYYIPNMNGNGYSLYMCFDYATSKYDNGLLDFPGDGIYNDWVIKVVPGDGSDVTPPAVDNGDEGTVSPDPEPTPDPEPNPNPEPDPDSEGDNDSDVSTDPVHPAKPEHVETNLSIEKHNDYLSTHLSIHVRANTDIEVFIPLKAEYYCKADDMEIVQKHEENFLVHGGPESLDYEIAGNGIKLSLGFELEGIRIATQGINQDVIEYLRGLTGDGITFEIWNYMNLETGLTDTQLLAVIREALNGATIRFIDNMPPLYVNAFNKDASGEKWMWDCKVNIDPAQYLLYNSPVTGYFLNGSPFNELYYKQN